MFVQIHVHECYRSFTEQAEKAEQAEQAEQITEQPRTCVTMGTTTRQTLLCHEVRKLCVRANKPCLGFKFLAVYDCETAQSYTD